MVREGIIVAMMNRECEETITNTGRNRGPPPARKLRAAGVLIEFCSGYQESRTLGAGELSRHQNRVVDYCRPIEFGWISKPKAPPVWPKA